MNIVLIILSVVLAIVLLLFLICLIRALTYKAAPVAVEKSQDYTFDNKKIVSDMQQMIRCRTISYVDDSMIDEGEFDKFQNLLPGLFPNVYKNCELFNLGKNGLLFKLQGKSSKNPSVMMSHYDVVPVNESEWTHDPFGAEIQDDVIYGRGCIDNKHTTCGILESVEKLLQEGFTPKNDLYLSFSGEEEIRGDTCPAIVDYLQSQGVKPAIVLDEGGAIVDKMFPGVSTKTAIVGVCEKGSVKVKCQLKQAPGHASAPPAKSLLGHLSRAILAIENNPFKMHLTPPTQKLLDIVGRNTNSFSFKFLLANLWLFRGVLDKMSAKSGGEINAMLRTTTAINKAEGSSAYNVCPPVGSFGMDVRIMTGDTLDDVKKHIQTVVNNKNIEVLFEERPAPSNPSRYSEFEGHSWDCINQAIQHTWGETIVAPFIMIARSDASHFERISNHVYRFSAIHASKEDRAGIHGNDEHISITQLIQVVEFYVRLISQL